MTSRAAVVAVVAVAWISATPPLVSAQNWIEVKSANFTVVSDAGAGRARDVAWQFEQIRRAIQEGFPWMRVKLDRPLTVLAARDENSMKALNPVYWERKDTEARPSSVFVTAADRHYISLRSDVKSDDTDQTNPYSAAYWSYAALTINEASGSRLPLWFRIGLSELLSNTIVRDTEVRFGLPIRNNLLLLREGRLRLSELIVLDTSSPYFTDGVTRGRFDAQCWALVHYLLYGRPDDRANAVNDLAQRLLKGESSASAIQAVFGSLDAFETAYMRYNQQQVFKYAMLPVQAGAEGKNYPSRPLPPAEAAAARAAYLAATNRPVEARARINEARKADPALPGPFDAEAMLLDRERQPGEARAAYEKAVDAKSTNAYVYYRLAALLWTDNADASVRTRIEDLLKRSVDLNSNYAPAYELLADIVSRRDPAAAVDLAARAVSLEPGRTGPRLAHARVLWANSRRADARTQAANGLTMAQSEQDRTEAQRLIDFFQRTP